MCQKIEDEDLPPVFTKSLGNLFSAKEENLIYKEMTLWIEKAIKQIEKETFIQLFFENGEDAEASD